MYLGSFDSLKVGEVWQISGRILEIIKKDKDNIYFDNNTVLTKTQIDLGNYLELKIN